MKTFKEILDEEAAIVGVMDEEFQEYMLNFWPVIDRASIRYANQQTQELQATILHYRNSLSFEDKQMYDEYFGITNQRAGVELGGRESL